MDAPDYVLEGERVALGPLRKDLADTYPRWVHDLDVRSGILTVGIYALEAEEAWVEETIATCGGVAPEQASFTLTNTAAIRAYEKAGFKPIGLRRDALSVMGRRGDELLMDAVADDFESPVLAARR
jgi:hypothetical protein